MSGLSQEHLNTYEKRYSPTCTNGHLSTAVTSLQRPIFWWTVHTSTLVGGSREGVRGAGGPGARVPPLFFDQNEARRAEKMFSSSLPKAQRRVREKANYTHIMVRVGRVRALTPPQPNPLHFYFPIIFSSFAVLFTRYVFREKYKKIEQYLSQEEVQTPLSYAFPIPRV